jgi:predicted RNase H-like HicB family nuclease
MAQYPSKFTVILEVEEAGGYSIHCPVLPGCSSQGDTPGEALANIKEAIRGILEMYRERGTYPVIETPELIATEIREVLADRAEDGLPLIIETREVELPVKVAI